jgi:hypothetical protein
MQQGFADRSVQVLAQQRGTAGSGCCPAGAIEGARERTASWGMQHMFMGSLPYSTYGGFIGVVMRLVACDCTLCMLPICAGADVASSHTTVVVGSTVVQ